MFKKLAVGCWFLAVGCWLLAIFFTTELIKPFSPALAGEKAFRSLRRRFDDLTVRRLDIPTALSSSGFGQRPGSEWYRDRLLVAVFRP